MPHKVLADIQVTDAIKRYCEDGVGLVKLARELGIDYVTLRKLFVASGIPIRPGIRQTYPACAGRKRCYRCLVEKDISEFHKDKCAPDGFAARCKICARPALHRRWMRRYGLTSEQYQALSIAQNGVCAICGLPEQAIIHGQRLSLAVDHDHDTGRVRGLLCHKCNRAVGLLDNNPDYFEAGAHYLKCTKEA